MICLFKNIVIIQANGTDAFVCSVDRDGNEVDILKEKKLEKPDYFRNYYCNNCKQTFIGEDLVDWEDVRKHFGTKPWFDVADSEMKDLNDPSIRPTIKKKLEVFNA